MAIIWAAVVRRNPESWYEDAKTTRPNRSKHGLRLRAEKDERRWMGRLFRRYVRTKEADGNA
jgi:hypothetical protein